MAKAGACYPLAQDASRAESFPVGTGVLTREASGTARAADSKEVYLQEELGLHLPRHRSLAEAVARAALLAPAAEAKRDREGGSLPGFAA